MAGPQFHTIKFSAEAVSIPIKASDLSLSAILKEDGGRLMTEAGFRLLKEQT